MRIIKRLGLFFFLFTVPFFILAQSDSCNLRVSLLTCTPGEELYSAWGHTAIRVRDLASGMDMVFNYGTFDDSDPDFYIKFTRGLMIYALSAYPFSDFLVEYKSQGRGITEQTLSLSCADKTKLFTALRINALQENRFYEYYFSTDNCTTRAKDMIVKNTVRPVTFNSIIPNTPPSFRNLIHSYLDKSNQAWSKLGIDILLGSNLDKKVTNDQAMFLPDYLMTGFGNAYMSTQPLVTETTIILTEPDPANKNTGLFSPGIIFSIMAVLIAGLSFLKNGGTKKMLNVFDTLFFLLLGLLGILLLVLWTIRIDDVCRSNFNLLWAFPLHFPAAFVLRKKTKWVQYYFKIIVLLTALTAAGWWLIPQQLNTTIAPLLAIILIRAWQRSKQANATLAA